MEVDIKSLKEDLKQECLAAFYAGGFGGALIESFNVDKASPEELIQIAQRLNIDISDYIVNNGRKR